MDMAQIPTIIRLLYEESLIHCITYWSLKEYSFIFSGALFIDLTLNPNSAPVRGRSRSTQRRLGSGNGSGDRTFTRPLDTAPLDPIRAENSSSLGVLSGAGPSMSSRKALPLTRGPLQKITAGTSQGRAPTKDECLSRQRELWCDPVGPWDVTPGVARWCLLNCRSDNCDNTRCSCQCIDETLFRFRYEQISLRAPWRQVSITQSIHTTYHGLRPFVIYLTPLRLKSVDTYHLIPNSMN